MKSDNFKHDKDKNTIYFSIENRIELATPTKWGKINLLYIDQNTIGEEGGNGLTYLNRQISDIKSITINKIVTGQYNNTEHTDEDSKITFADYTWLLPHDFVLKADDSYIFKGRVLDYNIKIKSTPLKPITDLDFGIELTDEILKAQSFSCTIFVKIKLKPLIND